MPTLPVLLTTQQSEHFLEIAVERQATAKIKGWGSGESGQPRTSVSAGRPETISPNCTSAVRSATQHDSIWKTTVTYSVRQETLRIYR